MEPAGARRLAGRRARRASSDNASSPPLSHPTRCPRRRRHDDTTRRRDDNDAGRVPRDPRAALGARAREPPQLRRGKHAARGRPVRRPSSFFRRRRSSVGSGVVRGSACPRARARARARACVVYVRRVLCRWWRLVGSLPSQPLAAAARRAQVAILDERRMRHPRASVDRRRTPPAPAPRAHEVRVRLDGAHVHRRVRDAAAHARPPRALMRGRRPDGTARPGCESRGRPRGSGADADDEHAREERRAVEGRRSHVKPSVQAQPVGRSRRRHAGRRCGRTTQGMLCTGVFYWRRKARRSAAGRVDGRFPMKRAVKQKPMKSPAMHFLCLAW